MAGVIRADVDEIDFRIVQHIREIFREIGHAELGGHGGRLVTFQITDGFDSGAWNLLVTIDMRRCDGTAADKADFDLFHTRLLHGDYYRIKTIYLDYYIEKIYKNKVHKNNY